MTETELIRGLQDGLESAFSILFEQYRDKIYNTALSMVQQEQDAENIVQDVFVKVYEKINGFRSGSALSTWIYRITVTRSIDFLRKRNRLRTSETVGISNAGHAPDFNHPGVQAEQKEKAAVLFKAITQLPYNQMAAFILQKTEGMTQAQIAQVMGLSEKAVESLLSRAKENLRKILNRYYHG